MDKSNPANRKNRGMLPGVFLIAGLVSFPFLQFGFLIAKPAVIHAGIQDVQNPSCDTVASRDEIFRIDETNRRLFAAANPDDLKSQGAKLIPRLNLLRAYVAKCRPAWGQDWNASFFANRELAGYKDEQLPRFMKDGSWAKAYLAEYENRKSKLTVHPALPNKRKVF